MNIIKDDEKDIRLKNGMKFLSLEKISLWILNNVQ